MRRQLDDLPAYYALAAGELGTTNAGTGGRGSDTPLGINVNALDLRLAASPIGTLGTWARVFREDLQLTDWIETRDYDIHDRTGTTLVEIIAWLQKHLARISESHPAIDEFATELAAIHREAQNAARAAPRQAWVVSCPSDDPDTDTGRCSAPLRITGADFGRHVRCRGCSMTWDVTRLLHVVATDRESSIWLPAEDAALLYGISERTLRWWAQTGIVVRERGRYDLASLRHALRRQRRA